MHVKFTKVSTKQAELGIGQASFTSYRYELVDYLPWMYMYEFHFGSNFPKELTSYLTLIHPFDNYTWFMAIVSSASMCLILIVVQKLWAHSSNESFHTDFIYQGINFSS